MNVQIGTEHYKNKKNKNKNKPVPISVQFRDMFMLRAPLY